MSFNVGFRPVSFRQQQQKTQVQQPMGGKIIRPTTPQPTQLPTSMPPLAGLVTPPPQTEKQPTYPLPPLAGIISAPPKNLPNTTPGPMAGNIKMP